METQLEETTGRIWAPEEALLSSALPSQPRPPGPGQSLRAPATGPGKVQPSPEAWGSEVCSGVTLYLGVHHSKAPKRPLFLHAVCFTLGHECS